MPQNRRSYEKTRRIALSGLLFALAMALSFIEGTLTIPGLLPGMKLGLANIVVMYALFFMGPRQALVLDVLKALLVFLVSGLLQKPDQDSAYDSNRQHCRQYSIIMYDKCQHIITVKKTYLFIISTSCKMCS